MGTHSVHAMHAQARTEHASGYRAEISFGAGYQPQCHTGPGHRWSDTLRGPSLATRRPLVSGGHMPRAFRLQRWMDSPHTYRCQSPAMMPNPMHTAATAPDRLQPPQNRVQSGESTVFWVLTPYPNRAIKRNGRRTGNSQLVHAASRADSRLNGCSHVTIVQTGLTAALIRASIPVLATRTPRLVLVTTTAAAEMVLPPRGRAVDPTPPVLSTVRGTRWCVHVDTRLAAGLTLNGSHAMLAHEHTGGSARAARGNCAASLRRACWQTSGR